MRPRLFDLPLGCYEGHEIVFRELPNNHGWCADCSCGWSVERTKAPPGLTVVGMIECDAEEHVIERSGEMRMGPVCPSCRGYDGHFLGCRYGFDATSVAADRGEA